MTTAVVIPCGGTGDPVGLARLLQAQQPAPEMVLVVGDLPPGAQLPPGVPLIAATGLSAAAARNLGARAVTADVLIFVDADVLPSAGWLAALLQAHRHEPTALVSAALELDSDSYWRRCDHRLAYAPILPGQPRAPRWLPAMSLLIPAPLWQQLGGFDESYDGAAGEDIDLSRRAIEQGAGLCVAVAARVRHNADRHDAAAVWQHQRRFGAVQRRLDRAAGRRHIAALRPLQPFSATLEALGWQVRTPGGRAHDLFGLIWGRLAWYRGYSSS